MKVEQVDQALSQKFVTEGTRLVFWHDLDGEFADYVGGSGAWQSRSETAMIQVRDGSAEDGLDIEPRLLLVSGCLRWCAVQWQ